MLSFLLRHSRPVKAQSLKFITLCFYIYSTDQWDIRSGSCSDVGFLSFDNNTETVQEKPFQMKMILTFADANGSAFHSNLKQCPKKCRNIFFFSFCILAQSICSTTESSAVRSVWREILYVGAYSGKHKSPTGILAPAGETRLSYQQCTGFLAQLCCQSFMLERKEEGVQR